MALRRKSYVRIEIVGISLLLLSIGWKFFIADRSSEITSGGEFLELNEKLNYLWLYVHDMGGRLGDDTAGAIAVEGLDEDWWDSDRRLDFSRKQTSVFNTVAGVLFLVGSVCAAIGRYGELTEKLQNHEAQERHLTGA